MAEFYKGFVFERDVSAPLTIEGNPVRVERGPLGKGFAAKLPSGETIDAASISAVARHYIIRSGDLARRNRLAEEHLKELLKGRAAWNRWRRENPHIKPVFANEDLSVKFKERTLAGYDFSYANLCQARMQGRRSSRRRISPGPTLRARTFAEQISTKPISRMHLSPAPTCRASKW